MTNTMTDKAQKALEALDRIWMKAGTYHDGLQDYVLVEKLLRTYITSTAGQGDMFICGVGGSDDHPLPKTVSICPAYGADWSQLYVRADLSKHPHPPQADKCEGLVSALSNLLNVITPYSGTHVDPQHRFAMIEVARATLAKYKETT